MNFWNWRIQISKLKDTTKSRKAYSEHTIVKCQNTRNKRKTESFQRWQACHMLRIWNQNGSGLSTSNTRSSKVIEQCLQNSEEKWFKPRFLYPVILSTIHEGKAIFSHLQPLNMHLPCFLFQKLMRMSPPKWRVNREKRYSGNRWFDSGERPGEATEW